MHRWHTPAVARARTHERRVNSPRNTVVKPTRDEGGYTPHVTRNPGAARKRTTPGTKVRKSQEDLGTVRNQVSTPLW